VVRVKECEIFNPDTSEYNGHLQIVLSNEGKLPTTIQNQDKYTADGKLVEGKTRKGQPSQGGAQARKHVVSKPMNYNEIR
jgi:hypothetical protein